MKHPGINMTTLSSDWNVFSDSKRRTCSSPCSSNSSSSLCSHSESVVRRPYSTITHHWTPSIDYQSFTQYTTLRMSTALGIADTECNHYPEAELEPKTEEIQPESDYDVLPARKALNFEEAIYDTPPSNRRASGRDHEMTDSIYDVPTSIFRRIDGGEERASSGALLIDMMACLGEDSADWVRAAATNTTCKP